jgi:hypothetical protein
VWDSKIVFDAQALQLQNPARACVNSESAFVTDRIRSAGYPDLAKSYWSWVCSAPERDPSKAVKAFGVDCYEQYIKLREIDKGFTMPEWGYKGT